MRARRGSKQRQRQYRALVKRDGERCKHCGATDNLTIDHVVPLSRGGFHAQWNLQLLCSPCNERKGSKLEADAA